MIVQTTSWWVCLLRLTIKLKFVLSMPLVVVYFELVRLLL